jgi:hypothetical protein
MFFSKIDNFIAQPPTNEENCGGAQNMDWVASQEVIDRTPVNKGRNGAGSNSYCTIA